MPSQCNMASTRRRLQRRAIVAMQHRPRWHRVDALSERRAPGQMRSMFGGIRVMHLETHDLAAIQVEDQIQVEPTPLHLRRKERHIPAPDLARAGGDVSARAALTSAAAGHGHAGAFGHERAAHDESSNSLAM